MHDITTSLLHLIRTDRLSNDLRNIRGSSSGGHRTSRRGNRGRSQSMGHHERSRIKSTGSVLIVHNTEDEDGGLYRCTANNSAGVSFLQVSKRIV